MTGLLSIYMYQLTDYEAVEYLEFIEGIDYQEKDMELQAIEAIEKDC